MPSSASTLLSLRERRTLSGATLTSGAEQVIDFVLPLFAGSVLGLSAWETGLLVAASQMIAFVARPFAGVIVDRVERTVVAAAGAAVFALACVLYAASSGLPLALGAAVLSGAAGAFLWVAVRAIIGERLSEDSGAFAKLVAAEETGGWVILVPAVILLSVAGYQWVFLGIALCCFAAAWMLFTARTRGRIPEDASVSGAELSSLSLSGLGRRLRPMLLAVVVTMAAEAAISLLLILHLQRRFDLGVIEIAYVFLPGAIAMSILPPYLHRLVVRYGRRRILMFGSFISALFAAGLAFAPSPPWITALWVLSAVAWSAVIPVQQAIIAEAAGGSHLGRGLGLYEAACLAGAFVGSLAAGFLYDGASWLLACLICSAIIASGVLIIPAAVRRLGVADHPKATMPQKPRAEHRVIPLPPDSECDDQELIGRTAIAGDVPSTMTRKSPKSRPRLLLDLAVHTILISAALLIAAVLIPSATLPALLGIGPDSVDAYRTIRRLLNGSFDIVTLVATALRIWVIIYAVDVIWTAWNAIAAPPRG